MGFAKRIILFLIVNFLVITTISIVLSLFNIQPYLDQAGIDYKGLLIMCLVWGMGGAFISLAISRMTAKWMMGVKLIDPKTRDPFEKEVLETVYGLAEKAELPTMPEVGIYNSPEINAFATGPTRSRALVAVSSGLLQRMDKSQVEGVLAHEVTHIANGDMVTMTLLQGIINAFVMFLARILAFILSGFGRDNQRQGSHASFMIFTIIFQIVFMVLGSIVVAWYSRRREYRADAGGAHLAGKKKMIHALEGLKATLNRQDPAHQVESLQTFKISNYGKHGLAALFATHPPIEDRIAALENLRE
ncbi:MAG: protease HtpX [Verrucomicrobia bacterium]|nr:protease HtpX [Verrucomicrobiota bacterium]